MVRARLAVAALFALTASASAHFVFVLPDAKNAEKAIVVFSDTHGPDSNVDIGKIGAIKLQARDAAGKDSPLTATKAEHALSVNVPAKSRVVFGSVDYGVLQRGDSKPYMLRYHPKAIIGSVEGIKIGEKLPIEIIPSVKSGKVRFLVLAKGKPLADAEVNLIPADAEKKQKVTTDKEGYTPEVEAKGRLALWTKSSEASAGESGGKKYEEVRDYATLVVDFDLK